MLVTAICPKCGDIIEDPECPKHPDEALVGEAIEAYLYG